MLMLSINAHISSSRWSINDSHSSISLLNRLFFFGTYDENFKYFWSVSALKCTRYLIRASKRLVNRSVTCARETDLKKGKVKAKEIKNQTRTRTRFPRSASGAHAPVSDPGDGLARSSVLLSVPTVDYMQLSRSLDRPRASYSHHLLHRHRRSHHLSGRYSSHITCPPASLQSRVA